MRLVCVCGRAGSGKSRAVVEGLRRALDEGRKAFLIVPDQFTLNAEHMVMDALGARGLMQAEVLSFSRLLSRVLEHCGQPAGEVLDARGRAMMTSRVLIERRGSLRAYGRYAHSPHFCAALAAQIAEFKRFDIDADSLRAAFSDQPRLLDIADVYQAYEAAMRGVYTDNEDRVDFMVAHIPMASFLQGAFVAIDEFEMLTSQVYRTVRALLTTAHEVMATFRLCQDGDADEAIFALEKKHLGHMRRIADEVGAEVLVRRLPDDSAPPRHGAHSALAHLEKNLFANPPAPFTGASDDVAVFSAPTVARECEECARRILTLVRDEGLRFFDIAVAAADLSAYGPLLQRAFLRYGIPSFLDVKRSVATHPLARYALMSLRVIQRGFAAPDALSLVKTGLSRMDAARADELEEMVRTGGIRYLGPAIPAHLSALYPTLESVRAQLFAPHDALQARLREARSAAQQAEAMMAFFVDDGLVDRLNDLLQAMEAEGDADGAMEFRQVYAVLCSLLTQMHTVMGDARMSLSAFYDHLYAGLYAQEVGVLPAVRDAVQVGTVDRSRSGGIRALFVLGFNDGLIPRARFDTGLLTAEDARTMDEANLFMGNNPHERVIEERFKLYSLLSRPQERLVLSYAQSDPSGETRLPSALLTNLSECLPALVVAPVQGGADAGIQTPASTLLPLCAAMRRARVSGAPLERPYATALGQLLPALSPRTRDWLTAGFGEGDASIGPALAAAAYSDAQNGAATALETLSRCAFRHFASQALMQPPPLRDYGRTAGDAGTYFHAVADQYLLHLLRLDVPLADVDRHRSDALLEALCGEHEASNYLFGPYADDGRAQQFARWHRRRIKDTLWQVKCALEGDGFTPAAFESAFARELPLDDGRRAVVRGRIDRIDIAQTQAGRAVRVVDYKSGRDSFSYDDVYYGLSLQLPLYALAAAERHDATCVGMFIQPLPRNLLACAPEEAPATRAKNMRLDGAYTKAHADAAGPDVAVCDSQKKDRLVDDDRYALLLRYGQRLALSLMRRRLSGDVRALPLAKPGENTGCAYCEYGAACGFDPAYQGGRLMEKMDGDAFFAAIQAREDDCP